MRRKEYSINATAIAEVLVMLLIIQIGGSYACIQPERQVLLNFKRSLTLSDNTKPLPSWKEDDDCCEWKGIACDNVTRHVVKIDLKNPCSVFFTVETSTESQQPDCLPADAFAEEDFSRHLSHLQYLTHLDLSGVAVRENPAFLGSMQRLRYLSLRVYYLPAASYTIPSGSLGNLTNLRALYLESLFFANVTDSSWLAPLSSLQYLGLKAVDLSMPQAHHLFKVLNTLPSLLHLHLPACSLGQVSSSLVSDLIFPLTNLTRLQLLNLAWNGLNQDSPVLHAFQNFTSIKVLDISRNFLNSVPPRLAKVHNLAKLDLSSNNITILDPLKNLTSIRVLNLNENNLNSTVPLWLGKFKNLVRLDLSRNILYGPVPCALSNLTSLTFLNLSNNHLNSLPSCLAELKSLIHLGLSKNNFTTVEEGFLPSILNYLCHLQFLDLSQSNCQVLAFKDKGTLSSCDSHALEYLDLSKNKFGGLLPNWLGQFKNLKYLNLMSNSFSSPIPFSIRNLTKLTVLNLGDNMFDGLIPHSLAQFVNLQHLNLSSNHFGDAIPQSMGLLKNLKSLDLSSNHFGGIIPQNLGQLQNLQSLDLSSNYLQGTMNELTNSLLQFTSLFFLDLSHNQISGSIPQSLQDIMPNLNSLILHNNLINGSLPSSLEKFEYLYSFDVSNNNLSGKIPSTFWNLSSLGWLHLNNNKFQGKLPSSLTKMKGLRLLDLGENQLSGFIPSWNGSEFSILQIIRMRKNMLSGSVPSSFCQFVSLQILDLAENNLVGPIPHCIGNITGMTSAYIPMGQDEWDKEHVKQVIKGRELDYIKNNLKYVVNLDLSSNSLSGSIPSGIPFLSGLIGFNLSYNNLSGKIPKMIGDMKSLESIDLSHNHLCGAIPRSMVDLTFLSQLNLSYNNLSGPIPNENQFRTFNDPLSYTGNQYLCGAPLPKYCPGDGPLHVPNIEGHDDDDRENDKLDKLLFYSVIVLGFATGFWGVIGFLYFKKNWRHVCFGYVEKIADKIYVAVVLKVVKLKKMMQRK